MTNSESIAAILRLIEDRDTFLISSHARPDGDAIGSAVGLMHVLEAMGKRVCVAFADPIPDPFFCLEGVERVVHKLPDEVPDAAILLECDSVPRTGFAHIPARLTINIDHHLSGREYADFNWIDPHAAAVGALIYDLAIAARVPISTAMSDCLYTAVLTDTGSFNYPGTSAETFALAGHLIQCGTDANRIAQAMYFSNPIGKIRLLGAALSNMRVKGEICWTVISQDDLAVAAASAEDCEGVVNHLISITGIEAAVLLRQQRDPNEYRLSLRSKGFGKLDVSRVAEHFGGGGHRTAAGCTLHGTAASIVDRLLQYIHGALGDGHPSGSSPAATPAKAPVEPTTLLA